MDKPLAIVILGPTSSGKTKWAVKLAHQFNGEIISGDSRQVYQGMDIGTGKDLQEYCVKLKVTSRKYKLKKISYHLIDIISPKKQFTAYDWQKLALKKINEIIKRKKLAIVVGGTGLYISALTKGYQLANVKIDKRLRSRLEKLSLIELRKKYNKLDPKGYQKIDLNNRRRLVRAIEISMASAKPFSAVSTHEPPPYRFVTFGIKVDRQTLNKRIDKRLDQRLEQGLVNEVKRLRKQGVSWKRLDDFGLEYRYVSRYLQGKIEYDEMVEKLKIAIHQFAKRQMTWFKRDKSINWINNYSQINLKNKK